MIKQILVPTDGSEHATIGAQYGIGLAKQHDASLIGLHIVDIRLLEGPFLRDISASLGTAPYVNYQNNIAAILEERGKATLEDFRKRCEALLRSWDKLRSTVGELECADSNRG